jgi:hypothetical protein
MLSVMKKNRHQALDSNVVDLSAQLIIFLFHIETSFNLCIPNLSFNYCFMVFQVEIPKAPFARKKIICLHKNNDKKQHEICY